MLCQRIDDGRLEVAGVVEGKLNGNFSERWATLFSYGNGNLSQGLGVEKKNCGTSPSE